MPSAAKASTSAGRSPNSWAGVVPSSLGIGASITVDSDTSVRWLTVPSGATKAENPVGDTWTVWRPVSTARSCDAAICWDCTWVSQ